MKLEKRIAMVYELLRSLNLEKSELPDDVEKVEVEIICKDLKNVAERMVKLEESKKSPVKKG